MSQYLKYKQAFTVIELLVTLLLMVVIIGIAVPTFSDLYATKKLYKGSEQLINHIKYYHSEAIKNNSNIYVSFKTGADWCYGIDNASSCDCETANDCIYDSVETVFDNSDFDGISLSLTGLSTTSGISHITFNGTRGTVATVGTVSLANANDTATASINKLGRTSGCSNTMNEYPSC